MDERLRIGRYEVLARLSAGGMAELFLAYFTGPGGFRKFVAVKRILPQLKDEEDFITMFLDEARISAALSHANIAQVFDLGEDADELYIAMEFIAGQDLSRINKLAWREGHGLPVGFAAKVARDACQGLHYAHTFTSPSGRPLPVIHRDLSLRNVMVTYSGNTRVIDFGIAKARGSLSTTQAGRVKGSSAYMSPEQIRGEELTGRSDVFSMGAVLYELLTGVRVFQGADDANTMYRVLNEDPRPVTQLRPTVSGALAEVVRTALAKDPASRFKTARDMARAIEAAAGPALFDEEAVAGWMAANFGDAMERTRAMLALAGEGDARQVEQAAASLQQESASAQGAQTRTLPGLGATPAPTTAVTTALPPAAMPSVLVVDDTRVGRMLVEAALQAQGYRVLGAGSGDEALALLERLHPDLIVLDVRMPGMDGFELCEQLRLLPHTQLTPVLFVSSACSLDERVRGLSAGGDDFIRKPFDEADLLSRVRLHLSRSAVMAAQR